MVWTGKLKEKGIQYKPEINPEAQKVEPYVPLHEVLERSFLRVTFWLVIEMFPKD